MTQAKRQAVHLMDAGQIGADGGNTAQPAGTTMNHCRAEQLMAARTHCMPLCTAMCRASAPPWLKPASMTCSLPPTASASSSMRSHTT